MFNFKLKNNINIKVKIFELVHVYTFTHKLLNYKQQNPRF